MTEKPKESLESPKPVSVENQGSAVSRLIRRLATAVGLTLGGVSDANEVIEPVEEVDDETRLETFRTQFEALSASARKNLTWTQVMDRMRLSTEELMVQVGKLEKARVFEVDKNNNLVFCDGGDEVPRSTLRKNYFECRNEARTQGLELFTEEEYLRLQSGERKYDDQTQTYIECGEDPVLAKNMTWYMIKVKMFAYPPTGTFYRRGARRLLRVPLK